MALTGLYAKREQLETFQGLVPENQDQNRALTVCVWRVGSTAVCTERIALKRPLHRIDPSVRALSGRLKFTVRRQRSNKDSPSTASLIRRHIYIE